MGIRAKCPKCNRIVYALAKECPYCGRSFKYIEPNKRSLPSRKLVIFILFCLSIGYYIYANPSQLRILASKQILVQIKSLFGQKTEQSKIVAQPPYQGDCLIKGFSLDPQNPKVRIDQRWFAVSDLVCGGRISQITKRGLVIDFSDHTATFGLDQIISK